MLIRYEKGTKIVLLRLVKKIELIKRFIKILKRVLVAILLLLILLSFILSRPSVRSYLAQEGTKYINKKYNTNIVINEIDLSNLKDIKLKDVVIKDHHNYPFIQVENLQTSLLNVKKVLDNELIFGTINLNGLNFLLKTYKDEDKDNVNVFADKFNTKKEKTSTKPFILIADKVKLKDSKFYLYDENKQTKPIVYYNDLNGVINSFKVDGPNIYGKITKTSFVDDHNISVEEFETNFTYTPTKMQFLNTSLKTKNSDLNLDMVFNYGKKDLSNFNNKVQIDATIKKASLSLIDLNHFYKELGKSDKIHFSTTFKGTLNDFKLKKLNLTSDKKSVVNGNFHFVNAFNTANGFTLNTDIKSLTSNYENLTALLPNILGKTLPSSFKLFGRFNLKGKSVISKEYIDAQLEITSDLGKSISDLLIINIDDIDNASYSGKIELIDFKLGKVINDSLIGNLSMTADVDGVGFTKEALNTSVIGHVYKHQYKGYTYSNIDINGVFKNQHFNGDLITNDENIKMTFNGLADLSTDVYSFKFNADVAFANFNKLNLFKKHSKSVLKGKIAIDIKGNSIDNIIGSIKFKDASYTNHIDNYTFKNFDVSASKEDEKRILKVNSKDIINGRIRGNFKFKELPKLAKNSLASIYTRYKPDSVSTGQYLDFNFKIYDKILGVFFTEIKLGKSTFIKGEINSDKEKFELTFKSPKVEVKENLFEEIKLQIDNKNPLYNTILSVHKINTKYYNLGDVNLVNVTLNDTLFIQTEFIGGKKLQEKYNLSLYHTINKENKSVVGFKKSEIEVKNQKWLLNEFNNDFNKVVFDNNFKNFDFKKLELVAGNQKIDFNGLIHGKEKKDLSLKFDNIILNKILPKIDSINLNGIANGIFKFNQNEKNVIPKIDLSITDFEINEYHQGDLLVKVKSDESFKKYDFNASLANHNIKILDVKGIVNTDLGKPTIDAKLTLNELNIKPYSALGGKAINNLRGEISGSATLKGQLKNPTMDGALFIENGGLAFPYLAVDYAIEGRQKISLENQGFDFNTTTLIDTKKQTEAILTGKIGHLDFKKWYLDLAVNTTNFLVLDTKEDEETPYYGTALVAAESTIVGFTDELTITVNAVTNPGTEFIVPLSNVNIIEENKLVRFINEIKEKDVGRPEEIVFNQKGLNLIIDLEVTPDAQAEIVIDKVTGSVLKGKGYAYLGIDIHTNGKFEMFGTYIVDEGEYQLKNIVNKTFTVKQGGKITWNGSPFDAFLDIEAVNKVKANPSILLENVQGTRNIDVNLITKITGNLYEPQMTFDIDLPNAGSLVKSELAFKINDEDKKMTQFFSLLGFGTFTNPDDADFANNGSSLLAGTLSERISSVISNLLKSKNDKFQIGFVFENGVENKLDNIRSDTKVGVNFETKLFNKIIINGEVGVPINSNSQSGVTGEIEAELPLNKAENFRLKMYNRRNEVEFDVLDSEGYTQGLGVSYQFNWDTGSEFLEKTGLRRTVIQKEKRKRKKDSLLKLKVEKKQKSLVNFSSNKKDSI